jgi:hypothetical protein
LFLPCLCACETHKKIYNFQNTYETIKQKQE